MHEQSKRVLSLFEKASQAGWLDRAELQAIHQELGAEGSSARVGDWLRGQVMQVLHRKTRDEEARRLVSWAEDVMALLATKPVPPESSQVFFAPGDDCHEALFALLDAARCRLDICVFTITDDRITLKIRRAAERGVAVRIITDDEKAWDPGSDIRLLAARGLPVRQDFSEDHMHHKFAIVDDRRVITGSLNWTKGATYNHENLLVCGDVQVVSEYRQEFDRLWDLMGPFSIT